MAFSQILGGWTKWGWPRLSGNVFLLAFIPVLVAAGWVLLATQPDANWFRDHVRGWSNDISIQGLVSDLGDYISVLAFGIGLVFGFTFDTSGPAVERPVGRRRRGEVVDEATPPVEDRPTARERRAADYDDTVVERDGSVEREPARTD
jgi:hypothetical protein